MRRPFAHDERTDAGKPKSLVENIMDSADARLPPVQTRPLSASDDVIPLVGLLRLENCYNVKSPIRQILSGHGVTSKWCLWLPMCRLFSSVERQCRRYHREVHAERERSEYPGEDRHRSLSITGRTSGHSTKTCCPNCRIDRKS